MAEILVAYPKANRRGPPTELTNTTKCISFVVKSYEIKGGEWRLYKEANLKGHGIDGYEENIDNCCELRSVLNVGQESSCPGQSGELTIYDQADMRGAPKKITGTQKCLEFTAKSFEVQKGEWRLYTQENFKGTASDAYKGTVDQNCVVKSAFVVPS